MRCRAVCLPLDGAAAAAALRLEQGIDVLETADALWLRIDADDERAEMLLRRLPGGRRYEILPDQQLRPLESRLPLGHLPRGTWQKIRSWEQVELPRAALPAQPPPRMPLSLTRTGIESPANVLLTGVGEWTSYGLTAPQIRLDCLRFAASADGQVVIHGSPLPPLPGARFSESGGIALPCGWAWSPDVDSQTLRALWNLETDDLALVLPDGAWHHIRGDQFVRATRGAIRESSPLAPASGRFKERLPNS
jgi:hypothetical protein